MTTLTLNEIVQRLKDGASADIWYDAHQHDDDPAGDQIQHTQEAMRAAAAQLREARAAFEEINAVEPHACTDASTTMSLSEWRGLCRDMSRRARSALKFMGEKGA